MEEMAKREKEIAMVCIFYAYIQISKLFLAKYCNYFYPSFQTYDCIMGGQKNRHPDNMRV